MKKRSSNKDLLALGAMVGFLLFSGVVLASSIALADDIVIDEVSISVPVSCSMSGTGMDSHTDTIDGGTYSADIGITTLKAYCNDTEGFAIYAVGYTGDEIGGTNSTKLVGINTNETINTGTNTGPVGNTDTSSWAMKLAATTGTYTPIIAGSTADTERQTGDIDYSNYAIVPEAYAKVAYRNSATDINPAGQTTAEGAILTTTYAAYIARNQVADTYIGKVKYTLVHPASEEPAQPQPTQAGRICYYANASNALGSMGCQSATDNASVTLLASNFSRVGYGFAGWSDAYDYATNSSAHFYGPHETITVPTGTTANGLSLYAVWVKSVGSLQNQSKVTALCGTNGVGGSLTTAPTNGTANLSSVSALTDSRDNQTYAIAKLADGKCWMIENLRLDNTATLTMSNTNNPLNDNTRVTLKHDYSDTETYNTLSASQDPTMIAWCTSNVASCDDQSRLFTGNTTNRATYVSGATMSNSASIYSYGNYYNWYSATAGRGTYSFSTNNNSVTGDLCPSGWRLPKGGNKTRIESNDDNDFWNLTVDALNGGTNPANYSGSSTPYYNGSAEAGPVANKLRSYPNNLVYSGYVSSGSVNIRGSGGYYWSSTVINSNSIYDLWLSLYGIHPGTGNGSKYFGCSVRCIASD